MFGIGACFSGIKNMIVDTIDATLDAITEGTEAVMNATTNVADKILEKTGIGDLITDTASAVYDMTEATGKAMSHGYKACTGELKYEEAKDLLDKIQRKANAEEKSYKQYVDQMSKKIKSHVDTLNMHRKKLREVDFEKFTTLVSMFSEWDIDPILEEKLTDIKEKKLNVNLNKEDLFKKIDFDEHALRENCLAIMTLGFLTRSRANQALENVKHQESRLNEEIKRLEAEKTRLKAVENSLQQAVAYFESFHGLYQNILSELEYSVNMLQGIYLLNKPFFFNGKVDPYYLPEKHLLCLMASEKMTRILHSMSKQRYISFDDKKQLVINKNEMQSVENHNKVVGQLKIALAVA